MAHTNGHIPSYGEHVSHLHTAKIEAELEFYRKLAESYATELRNIPEAIEKYGYWDYYDKDGKTISLVKKEPNEKQNTPS